SMPAANALVAALVTLPFVGALAQAQSAARWLWPTLVLGAAAAGAIAWAALSPSYSPARPLSINVNYVSDAVEGEARLVAGPARRALPPGLSAAAPFAPLRVMPGDRAESWAAPVAMEAVTRPALENVS